MYRIIFIVATAITLSMFAAMDRDPNTSRRVLNSRKSLMVVALAVSIPLIFVLLFGLRINKGLRKSSSIRAIGEIENIELSVTKIISDIGHRSFNDFFDCARLEVAVDRCANQHGIGTFDARVAIYTRATYALLRHGRNALTLSVMPDDTLLGYVQSSLRTEVVRNLRTEYMSKMGNDPWGNPYRIFAGPWPSDMGPVVFRIFRTSPHQRLLPGDPLPEDVRDALTASGTDDPEILLGLPASPTMDIYVWSYGKNGRSDQPNYDPTHQYAPPIWQHYGRGIRNKYLGGGDDINNWDRENSFMQFYN